MSVRTFLHRTRWQLLGLLPAGIAAFCYSARVAPCVTGDDPAEMQVMTWTFGLPHGPSYPLYISLARLFTLLPLGDFARRVNLFSVVAAAVALWLVWVLVFSLLSYRERRTDAFQAEQHVAAAILGSATALALLACSHTFVAIAIISEMYTLQVMLSLAAMLLLVRWATHKRAWQLFAGVGLLGLSLGNHNTTFALFPGALVFVLLECWADRSQVRRVASSVLVGLAGAAMGSLLPFYLLWRNHVPCSHWEWIRSCPLFFQTPANDSFWYAWWYEFTNQQFRHEVLSAPHQQLMDQLGALPYRLIGEFLVGGAALALAGWLLMWPKWRANLALSLVIAVHCYVAISLDLTNKTHIYVMVPVAIAAVYAGYAVGRLGGWLESLTRTHVGNRRAVFAVTFVLAGLVGGGGVLNARSADTCRQYLLAHAPAFACNAAIPRLGSRPDEHRDTAYRGRIHRLVAHLPEDAIVFSNWYEHYAIEYVNRVERGVNGISVYESYPYGRGIRQFPEDYLKLIRDPNRKRRVFFVFDARPPSIEGHLLVEVAPDLMELTRQ